VCVCVGSALKAFIRVCEHSCACVLWHLCMCMPVSCKKKWQFDDSRQNTWFNIWNIFLIY